MRHLLPALFERPDKPISRGTYITAGASLMLFKYAVDATAIGIVAGVWWTPVDYLMPLISFEGRKVATFPCGCACGCWSGRCRSSGLASL